MDPNDYPDYADNIIFDMFVEDIQEFCDIHPDDIDEEDIALDWVEKQTNAFRHRDLHEMRDEDKRVYFERIISLVEDMIANDHFLLDQNINILKSYVDMNLYNIPGRYYPIRCKKTS